MTQSATSDVPTARRGAHVRLSGVSAGDDRKRRAGRRLVGGLVSSTALTLILIPVVYYFWKRWELKETLARGPITEGQDREVTHEGD